MCFLAVRRVDDSRARFLALMKCSFELRESPVCERPTALDADSALTLAKPTFNRPRKGAAPGPLLTRGTALTVALAAAAVVTHLVNFGAFDLHIRALNTNTHASIFGVISLLALAAAFAAAAVTAARSPDQRVRGSILAGALGILLALRVVHPPDVVLLALPSIAAAFILLWWWRAADGHARRVLRAGCLLLAASLVFRKLGYDAVTSLGYGVDTWAYQVRDALRHALELAGWLLVATALLASALQSTPRERRARST
jgi:hypothetical protein